MNILFAIPSKTKCLCSTFYSLYVNKTSLLFTLSPIFCIVVYISYTTFIFYMGETKNWGPELARMAQKGNNENNDDAIVDDTEGIYTIGTDGSVSPMNPDEQNKYRLTEAQRGVRQREHRPNAGAFEVSPEITARQRQAREARRREAEQRDEVAADATKRHIQGIEENPPTDRPDDHARAINLKDIKLPPPSTGVTITEAARQRAVDPRSEQTQVVQRPPQPAQPPQRQDQKPWWKFW